MSADTEKEREKDDAALGHGLRVLFSDLIDKFKYIIMAALIVGWTGREAARAMAQPQKRTEGTTLEQVNKKLDRIGVVLVEVQVTNRAMLDILPREQRAKVQTNIDNSLATLRLSKDLQP